MISGNPVAQDDVRGPAAFEQSLKVEQEATRSFLNQPMFLPGVLQVAGYAAAMIGGILGLPPGDARLAELTRLRMQRAEAFTKRLQSGATAPHLWAVIDEAVLRRPGGGPGVMRQQVDHLITMSRLDTVHLGIVPLSHGPHPGLGGSFEVHETPNGGAVFFEGTEDEISYEPSRVRHYRETAEGLYASAVTEAEAESLLGAILSTL
jgi:hypothetical protein